VWQFIALLLTIISATLIYLTNKHQTLISNTLPKYWRLIGYINSVLALFSWLQLYVLSASIFIWLFTSIVTLICIPLLNLYKNLRYKKESI
jgi:membrane protein YdbS with pleckstrin-like domain